MDPAGAGHGAGTVRGIARGTILGIHHGMVITIIGMPRIGAPTTIIQAMVAAPAVRRWDMVAT